MTRNGGGFSINPSQRRVWERPLPKTSVHLIDEVNFRENWVQCLCGERVQAVDFEKALNSRGWSDHMRAVGKKVDQRW